MSNNKQGYSGRNDLNIQISGNEQNPSNQNAIATPSDRTVSLSTIQPRGESDNFYVGESIKNLHGMIQQKVEKPGNVPILNLSQTNQTFSNDQFEVHLEDKGFESQRTMNINPVTDRKESVPTSERKEPEPVQLPVTPVASEHQYDIDFKKNKNVLEIIREEGESEDHKMQTLGTASVN